MAPNADDYAWVATWSRGLLTVGYCLSFVRGEESPEVLEQLGVTEPVTVDGAAPLATNANEAWSHHRGAGSYVGVTTMDGWSVMLEFNGWLGSVDAVLGPLSRHTVAVSHYRNVNALDRFLWFEDGTLQVAFEPLFPTERHGAAARVIEPQLIDSGFDLRTGPDRDFRKTTAAAFALGERLTGVHVTPERLETSRYRCGIARLPST